MLDGKRVLIVEDNEPALTSLARIFAGKGWDVCTAATLEEGLACLDPPSDCVVLDLNLPDGQGEAILQRLRETGLPSRVVAVTTGVDDPDRLTAVIRLRPEVVLMKPIDPEALCQLCAAAVGG
jgi:DNA-binding response OmpR family regulator